MGQKYGKFEELVLDGTVYPATDNVVDLGASTLEFKDIYIDGSAYIDGIAEDTLLATDKKVQFRDTGLYIQSGADGKLTVSADGTGSDDITLSGTVTIADTVTMQGALDYTGITPSGTTPIVKCGTSGTYITTATANTNFLQYYLINSATSGDNRGMYLRLQHTGAGGGGEAARIFTNVQNVAGGTAHGAHISLSFGATGTITGLGVASRNTLHIPNASLTGGTYAATQPEIYSDGSSSAFNGTELSFIRVTNDGNATGIADIDDKAFLLTYTGGSTGAGNVVAVKSAAAVSHTIRVKLNGTTYYLMVSDAQ